MALNVLIVQLTLRHKTTIHFAPLKFVLKIQFLQFKELVKLVQLDRYQMEQEGHVLRSHVVIDK